MKNVIRISQKSKANGTKKKGERQSELQLIEIANQEFSLDSGWHTNTQVILFPSKYTISTLFHHQIFHSFHFVVFCLLLFDVSHEENIHFHFEPN